MNRFARVVGFLAIIGGLATAPVMSADAAQEKQVKIGWTAWADCEAVTKLAKKILEDRLGYKVDLVLADIGIQYQALAKGDIDTMLMSWLPTTHKNYMDKVGSQIVDIGPLYTRARLGWVVPDFVPADQLSTVEDLKKPDIAKKLANKIQGIDPGAGLMQASEKAIKDYGLSGYNLVSASDAAMVAAVDRAVKRNEWMVATAWSPHVMFAKVKLRYLDDPKGVLGGLEHVDALARRGLYEEHPELVEFLSRMKLPIGEVEQIMAEATAEGGSYEKAVDAYIKDHPARVNYWVTGNL
jgi:glycine betaine/proline transport system substrate-binding protein